MESEQKLPPLDVKRARWVWYGCEGYARYDDTPQNADILGDDIGMVEITVSAEDYDAALARAEKAEALINVSYQRTICAVCLEVKHTPVRNDSLGGYVCGGCLEDAYEKAEALNAEHVKRTEALIQALRECVLVMGGSNTPFDADRWSKAFDAADALLAPPAGTKET